MICGSSVYALPAAADPLYASADQPSQTLGEPAFVQETAAPEPEIPEPVKKTRASRSSRVQLAPERFAYRDLGSLGSLANADLSLIGAAYRIIRKHKKRRLVLLDYRFTDTNGDGSLEAVTLSLTPDAHDRTRFVVGVYEFEEDGEPVLRFEKKQQQTAPYDPRSFSQSIDTRPDGFALCERWRMQSWDIRECHDLRLDREWNPQVLYHRVDTVEQTSGASQSTWYRFRDNTAGRAYSRLPDGAYLPALRRETSYAMLFASFDDDLPETPVSVATGAVPAFSQHEPLRVGARWSGHGLYLSVDAIDLDVFDPESCTSEIAVQKHDHAELWLDLNPALETRMQAPEAWQIEYQKSYHNEPYRHDADNGVFGIAVTPNGCIVPMTPRDNWPAQIQAVATRRASGYHLDFYVPASFFGVTSMHTLHRGQGLSLTIRQHDRHEDSFDDAATSTFEWPDPFTFGQIWLTTPDTPFPPPFPMQWDTWLHAM